MSQHCTRHRCAKLPLLLKGGTGSLYWSHAVKQLGRQSGQEGGIFSTADSELILKRGSLQVRAVH